MFSEGITLMIMGMGGVFVFLTILVILMNIAASFFQKYSHIFADEEVSAPAAAVTDGNEDVAIAIAAVTSFNK